MPPSTAIRAATRRSGNPTRDQCGLTAIARSSGQAGAMAWQARSHAAFNSLSQSTDTSVFALGVAVANRSSERAVTDSDVFMVFSWC